MQKLTWTVLTFVLFFLTSAITKAENHYTGKVIGLNGKTTVTSQEKVAATTGQQAAAQGSTTTPPGISTEKRERRHIWRHGH